MKHIDIEDRLKSAVENSTPDILDDILADLNKANQKNNVTDIREVRDKKQEKKSNKKIPPFFRGMIAGAAALVLIVLGALAFGSGGGGEAPAPAVNSIVALDVNPSLELKIGGDDKVVEANALNDDAVAMLDGMKLEGTDLDVAINAIIGAMLKNGYIDELANSVLVSVADDDEQRNAELRDRLAAEIEELIETYSLEGSVLTQSMTQDEKVLQMAEEYGITHAKAQLIYDAAQADETLIASELAKLSINEINLILSSRGSNVETVSTKGSASDKAYIGEEAALAIALEHADVKESDITELEIEIDSEDGGIVYEVEFCVGGYEYEYEIDAKSGKVMQYEREKDEDGGSGGAGKTASAAKISAGEAKSIALKKAGVSEADIKNYDIELENSEYEVEFVAGGYEYEFDISASTGEILKYEKEREH